MYLSFILFLIKSDFGWLSPLHPFHPKNVALCIKFALMWVLVHTVWGWWYMAGECDWDKWYCWMKSGNVGKDIPLEMIRRLIWDGRFSRDVKHFQSIRLQCQSDCEWMQSMSNRFLVWEETGRNSGFLRVNLPASRLGSQRKLPQ